MTVKTIKLQIVKNLGNYETTRLEIEADILDTENVQECFEEAKKELEKSFIAMYSKKQPVEEKREQLSLNTKMFDRVCKAMHEGKADFAEIQKHFIIDKDVIEYLIKNKLI